MTGQPLTSLEQQNPSRNGDGMLKALTKTANPSSGAQGPEMGPDDALIHGPSGQLRKDQCGSVLSLQAERVLQEANPAAYDKLTNSFGGFILQGALLVGTVLAYVGNPILVTWTKTVGYDDQGGAISTTAYMEVLLIWMMKLSMTAIGLFYAVRLDWGSGSWGNVAQIFNVEDLKRWNLVALGWSIADVAEQMAGGRLNPALYTVFSQSRLVGTAVLMRVALGTKRPNLQWVILCNLSLVIIGYRLIGAGSKDDTVIGFIATAVKMVLSVTCGVAAQVILQNHNAERHFIVVISQMTLLSLFWMSLVIPFYIYVVAPYVIDQPWEDTSGDFAGIFGGRPWCPNGEKPAPTACPDEAIDITAWSWKVWVLLAFNIYRDYTVSYILKIFDALVKNLCNALATVVAYVLTVTFLGNDFEILKGIFSVVIAFEIMQYALAQNMPMENEEKAV